MGPFQGQPYSDYLAVAAILHSPMIKSLQGKNFISSIQVPQDQKRSIKIVTYNTLILVSNLMYQFDI
jgi:hypothetical protein